MDHKNAKNIERASSSSKKFNTELFNIPFAQNDNNVNNISNTSIISQHSNNDISFHNVSYQKSVNSSQNNIGDDKKRKPFDSLHFLEKNADNMNNFEESINSITNSNINSEKRLNISDSLPKSNAETEITTIKMSKNNCNIDNQENAINNSKLSSELNKSSLMKTQSALNKDIVEKALKYNKANDKENCPFWVKFFLDENNLKQNSSYFKAKDKDLYIKTMLEITKNDAKLEEKTRDLKEKKEKTFFELKKLLLTEIKEENKYEEEKLNHLEEDSKISVRKENNNQAPNKNKKENLVNVLSKYTDSNKKDMYFDKQVDINYHEYIRKQKELEESNNFVQKNIKNATEIVLLNKYSHAKSHVLNKEEIYKNEDQYIGIDQLDFDKENFENVHFRYYGKNTIKSLMEIDKKLEKLNPTHSNYSTKNDLKYMKEACKKPNSKNAVKSEKPLIDKYSKQTTKSKNEDKYIDRNSDIRVRRELKTKLNEIDTKLLLNQRQEFDTKRIEDFIDEFNKAKYSDPSEREKDLNFKIPEEAIFNKMDEQFEDCDRRIKEIKLQISEKVKMEQEFEKNAKENLNKPKELSQEEIAYQKKLDRLLNCLENEEKETNTFLSGLDSIQAKIIEENKNIDLELDNVQELIRKNETEYDKIINKYEEEIEQKYAEEDNNDDFEEEKGADYYYKLYGVEDIIHHDYKNDVSMNKSFQNDFEKLKNNDM